MPRDSCPIALRAIMFAAICTGAFGQSIQNGDFECVQIPSGTVGRDAATIPGWTRTGAGGDFLLGRVGYQDASGGINRAGHGNQFVVLGGGYSVAGDAAWTTIISGLVPGRTYTLRFMIAAEYEAPSSGAENITVSFERGATMTPRTFTAPPSYYYASWADYQVNFVATDTCATLKFSVTNQLWDVALDYVRVLPVGDTGPGTVTCDPTPASCPGATQPLTITTSSPLPNGKVGLAYSQTLGATGGAPAYSWSLAAGALPAGLTLNPASGAISGTPTAAATAQFTARVTDTASNNATKPFALTVDMPAPACTFVPQNSALGIHRPEWHDAQANPDHQIGVVVTADGVPVPQAQVSLTATEPLFQVAGGQTAASTTAATGAAGRATLVINPYAADTFNEVDMEATGSFNGRAFRCSGSVTVGGGTIAQLALDAGAAGVPASLSAVAAPLLDPLYRVGRIFGLGPPDRDPGPPLDLRPMPPLRPQASDMVRSLSRSLLRGEAKARAGGPAAGAAGPVISFADLIGGSGTDAASAMAVDAQGNIYITGATNSGDFPVTVSGQKLSGLGNVFVTKLDPTGTKILYSTLIGGLAGDAGFAIAVDSAGSAYVAGNTTSPNFPVKNALQSAPRNAPGAIFDAFVFKLSPSGADLVYSTFLGGAGNDLAKAIAVDSAGSAIVVGATNSRDFPLRNAAQSSYRGDGKTATNAFVAKLNPAGTDLVYSTYLGGTGTDAAGGVAVDSAGNAYVAGVADSTDFPTVSPLQAKNGGGRDAFVAKLSPAGALLYSTYLGGAGDDGASGIALDPAGNVYVAGATGSADFPQLRPVQPSSGPAHSVGMDVFVAKLAPGGNALVYSTSFGGSGVDLAGALAVAGDGSVYVTGETTSADFPAVTPLQRNGKGSNYAFLAKLNPAGSALLYSSMLGGSGPDSAASVAVHAAGAYIAGTTRSPNFPVTYGGPQAGLRGKADATVVKVLDAGTRTPAFASLHGATFLPATGAAPESIVAGFGENLAESVAAAESTRLPLALANTAVGVKDAKGNETAAPLFFVSPAQINYLVPPDAAPGLAAVTVRNGGQTVASGTLRIEAVAPGLFSANADGKGVAAAIALKVAADGAQTANFVFACGQAPGSCAPDPIDLGDETSRVYLLLFGTGIRGRGASAEVTVGGTAVPLLSAGPQPEFAGLDQVNVGPLPRSLAGRKQVDVLLSVDGKAAVPVTIAIR